jgi:hypothetical protein
MKETSFFFHINESDDKNIPDYLYHYTSLSSFEKIVKANDILLFDSYQLNDYMENNVLLSVINSVLSENKNLFTKEYIDALTRTFNYKYRISLPYVFCLSEKYNSLSQWRNYGDECNGICIKFSTKKLGLKYRLPQQNVDSSYLYSIHNIIYSFDEQKKIVFDILSYALDISKGKGNIKEESFAEYAFAILSRFMSVFKMQEFSEESEWRIIYMPWLLTDANGSFSTFEGRKDIIFFTTRNSIKSCFPFFKDTKKFQDSIVEVMLGTKSKVSDFEIRTFLDYYHLPNVGCSRSNISYR